MPRSPLLVADPFSNTADPAAYVPRTATESVLVRLELALRGGAPMVVLAGQPGSGKTLLLRVLAERLDGDFNPIYVPYPKLSPEEFCQWALAVLNEVPYPGPLRALRARIARDAVSGFPPILWMVDDAGCMPLETLRLLMAIQAEADGALRVVWVGSSGFPVAELQRASVEVPEVELEGDMLPAETARYVRARLDHAGADPRSRARLEGAIERLHELSAGNPGRLHALASEMMLAPERETIPRSVLTRSHRPSKHVPRRQGDPPREVL